MRPVYIFFIVSLVFFLGVVVYFNIAVLGKNFDASGEVVSQADFQTESLRDPSADSDADGLQNWEEDLYGTSKKSADSDGDGVGDGQEVANGSDPTIYGDAYRLGNDEQVIQEQVYSPGFEPTSPSIDEQMLQDLVAGGDPLALAEMLGIELPEGLQAGSVVSKHQNLKNDINAMGIVVQNASVTSIADVEKINNYFFLEAGSGDESVTLAIEADAQAAERMNTMTSSNSIIQGFINRLAYHYFEMAQAMRTLQAQGYTGEGVVPEEWILYTGLVSTWLQTIQDIHEFVIGNDITFESTEPGYIFVFETE